MIAHVAAAGENKGRVLLCIGGGDEGDDFAANAAFDIAKAYSSEIEVLAIGHSEIARAEALSLARHVSHWPSTSSTASWDDISRDYALLSERSLRAVELRARRRNIPFRSRMADGDGITALKEACLVSGPWNAIVLGSSHAQTSAAVAEIFTTIEGATAVIACKSCAMTANGQVLAVIEDQEQLPSILRVAQRISFATRRQPRIMIVASNASDGAWLDAQARLTAGPDCGMAFDPVHTTASDVFATTDIIRRQKPAFVIARFGGTAAPDGQHLDAVIRNTGAAYFLVR